MIPGAEQVERAREDLFRATIAFGAGRVRGRYRAEPSLPSLAPPCALELAGASHGALGGGEASARVELVEHAPCSTGVAWVYEGAVRGPVAVVGRPLLQAASDLFVRRFFQALRREVEGRARQPAARV